MAPFATRKIVFAVSACLLLATVANVILTLFGGDGAGILEVLSIDAQAPTRRTLEIEAPSASDNASAKSLQDLEEEVAEVRLAVSDIWQTVTELAQAALPRTDKKREPSVSLPISTDNSGDRHEPTVPLLVQLENNKELPGGTFLSKDFTIPFTPTAFSCPAPKLLAFAANQSITSDADLTATQCGTPVSRGFLFHRLRLALVAAGPGLTSARAGDAAYATIHACPVSEDHSILDVCRELTLWGRLKGPSSVFNANISAQHSKTTCQWRVSYVVPRDAVVDVQTYELQLVNTWYGGPVGPNTATCNEVVDATWLPTKGDSDMTSLQISYRNGPKYLGSNAIGRAHQPLYRMADLFLSFSGTPAPSFSSFPILLTLLCPSC